MGCVLKEIVDQKRKREGNQHIERMTENSTLRIARG